MKKPPPARRIAGDEVLLHVSRRLYKGAPLHFGRRACNRYDDPAGNYGVLYLGMDLPTALMESVFHQHRWHETAARVLSMAEVERRLVRVVGVVRPLRLADLTAPGVMSACLGLNLEQLSSRGAVLTQRLSSTLHALSDADGVPVFDGILYPSRNNYPGRCVALFERAADRIVLLADIPLVEHVHWPDFVRTYDIALRPVPGVP